MSTYALSPEDSTTVLSILRPRHLRHHTNWKGRGRRSVILHTNFHTWRTARPKPGERHIYLQPEHVAVERALLQYITNEPLTMRALLVPHDNPSFLNRIYERLTPHR